MALAGLTVDQKRGTLSETYTYLYTAAHTYKGLQRNLRGNTEAVVTMFELQKEAFVLEQVPASLWFCGDIACGAACPNLLCISTSCTVRQHSNRTTHPYTVTMRSC